MESSKPITTRPAPVIRSFTTSSNNNVQSQVAVRCTDVANACVEGDWPSSSDVGRATAFFGGRTRTAEDIYLELYPGTTKIEARTFFDRYQSPPGKRKRDFDLDLAQQMEQELKVPNLAKKPRLAPPPGGGASLEGNLHIYVVPPKFRESIGKPLVYGKTPGDLPLAEFSVFLELKKKVREQTNLFFQTATLPEKPVMPKLDPESQTKDIIAKALNCSPGMVIQDGGADIGSKKFLIDNMGTFAEQGVKTFYMCNVATDFHQDDLDDFFETGQMPEALKLYLDALDIHALDEYNKSGQGQKYTFCGLVEAARAHGIKTKASDAIVTLCVSGIDPDQMKMRSCVSSEVINANQQANGGRKWVALEDRPHSASDNNSVPGIAELQGAIYIPSRVFQSG